MKADPNNKCLGQFIELSECYLVEKMYGKISQNITYDPSGIEYGREIPRIAYLTTLTHMLYMNLLDKTDNPGRVLPERPPQSAGDKRTGAKPSA